MLRICSLKLPGEYRYENWTNKRVNTEMVKYHNNLPVFYPSMCKAVGAVVAIVI